MMRSTLRYSRRQQVYVPSCYNFGVGFNLDLAAADRGLAVSNTPGVTDASAEIAMTLLLMCARQTGRRDAGALNNGRVGTQPTCCRLKYRANPGHCRNGAYWYRWRGWRIMALCVLFTAAVGRCRVGGDGFAQYLPLDELLGRRLCKSPLPAY